MDNKNRNLSGSIKNEKNCTVLQYNDGTIERLYLRGQKKIEFPNNYVIVIFDNDDVKQYFPDGTEIYYFKEPDIA